LEKGQIDGIVRRDAMRGAVARLVDYGRGAFGEPTAEPAPAPRAEKKSRP